MRHISDAFVKNCEKFNVTTPAGTRITVRLAPRAAQRHIYKKKTKITFPECGPSL